jgi:ATP-binding cassette subfamily C protein CydC
VKKTAENRGKGWIWPHWKTHPWRFIAAAFAGLLATACAAALLFTSGYLISRSALRPENVLLVYVPIVLVRTFGFSKAVVQYIERLISHDTVLRILSRMRVKLYRIIEPQALQLRSLRRAGDLLGMLAEDIEQLQNVYLRLILPAVTAVLIYGAGMFMLGRMDGPFALLMSLYCSFLFITLPVFSLLVSRKMRKHSKVQRSLAYQELTDGVFGMSDWILSGRTARFLAAFSHRQAQMAAADQKNRRSERRIQWLAQCAISGAVVLMALWAGQQNSHGAMNAEWIAAFALVGFPVLDMLVKTGEAVVRTTDYRESVQRLQEIENSDSKNELAENELPDPTTESISSFVTDDLDKTIRTTPPHPGQNLLAGEVTTSLHPRRIQIANDCAQDKKNPSGLLLVNVSYRYPGSENWSLRDIHLHVPPGCQVAIIGRSGAGKTTLFNLIQGELVPDRGSITINGISVRQFHYATSRPFAVLNQQPYLFDTTIANNIRLGRPGATDEEVRKAAELAGLGRLIGTLPDGLDTKVREAGARFSGGERQRIALARVLLQNRPIVLLDEPTVGLDPLTERGLLDTMFTALRGKTLLWITHHLSGMERMDRIVFLDQGRIAMQGTHEHLLQNYERYRKLYALDRPELGRV